MIENFQNPNGLYDCLIVGGGAAGLTAAIYLSRFHLSVLVIDSGNSRMKLIPTTNNHAGFPHGIPGAELLARMVEQAQKYGVTFRAGEVRALTKQTRIFEVVTDNLSVKAKTVLLATGVFNRRPELSPEFHDAVVAQGLLRYCPVCDGYEVTDRVVAVLGTAISGLGEAEFLRSYTADVTLIDPKGAHVLDQDHWCRIQNAGIKLLGGPCLGFEVTGERLTVILPEGVHHFDSVYPALGTDVRAELAIGLGAAISTEGGIVVDTKQRTNVVGLYAAGDVVQGLDQISFAMGQASCAAVTIRNDLAKGQLLHR